MTTKRFGGEVGRFPDAPSDMVKRTERTIEDYDLGYTEYLPVYWNCPDCKSEVVIDVKSKYHHSDTCTCGYVWQVEIRPRFYITRE